MKRQLTEDERKAEKAGLTRNEKEMKMLKQQLEYNKDMLAKQKYVQDHEDKWRPFLREVTEYENKKIIQELEDNIAVKKQMIKIAESNLRDGVEVKNHSVNS